MLILNEPSIIDGEELVSCIPSTHDTAIEAEDYIFLEEALTLLTRKQRRVIFETVIEDVPEHVVASKFGISQQAVHLLKIRALRKLRAYLQEHRY